MSKKRKRLVHFKEVLTLLVSSKPKSSLEGMNQLGSLPKLDRKR